MSVYNVLNKAIQTKLEASAGLFALLAKRIYYLQAPAGRTLPYVIYSHYGGGPDNINPSDMHNNLVYVRGYADNQQLSGSIDYQCYLALHKQTLSVVGYTNFATFREMDVPPLVEHTDRGEDIYSSGGVYRIRLTD